MHVQSQQGAQECGRRFTEVASRVEQIPVLSRKSSQPLGERRLQHGVLSALRENLEIEAELHGGEGD